MSGTGYPPYDWRIDAIERKAEHGEEALRKSHSTDGRLDSLEHSVRELGICIDGLRIALDSTLNRVETLEREIERLHENTNA